MLACFASTGVYGMLSLGRLQEIEDLHGSSHWAVREVLAPRRIDLYAFAHIPCYVCSSPALTLLAICYLRQKNLNASHFSSSSTGAQWHRAA
jgi:hypothetical protein